MGTRPWKETLFTVPGIGVALLPKLVCPLCWPLYAGILSSIGLGFLISATYLLPFTIAFLTLTLGVLAFRAKQHWGYGPLALGIAASATVVVGKFYLELSATTYSGIALLVAASVWNAWPRRIVESCFCKSERRETNLYGTQGR